MVRVVVCAELATPELRRIIQPRRPGVLVLWPHAVREQQADPTVCVPILNMGLCGILLLKLGALAQTSALVSHVPLLTHVYKVPATPEMAAALTPQWLARVLLVFAATALVFLAAALAVVVFAQELCAMDSLPMHSLLLALTVLPGMHRTLSRGILILILQAVSGASPTTMLLPWILPLLSHVVMASMSIMIL